MSLNTDEPNGASLSEMEADVADIFGLSVAQPNEADAGSPSSSEPSAEQGGGADQAPSSSPEPSQESAEQISTQAPEATGKPALATPAAAPAAEGAEATTSAASAEPPKPDEQALKLQSLEATVEALQAELASARANPAQGGDQQQAEPAAAGESAGQELPRYQLTLPQQVAEAIFYEDPTKAAAGITSMMNSLATIIHHNCRVEFNARLAQMEAQREAAVSAQAQTQTVETGRKQYYAAFPAHDNELILPLIQAEARQMAVEFPNLKWDENYINALGSRVNNRIAALTGAAQPTPAVVVPPQAPAASLPSGTRGETPGTPLEGADLIADTFS